jgi:quercetin 2,3-dioxygenase
MRTPDRGDGADFDWSKPYRHYHSEMGVPGFPRHPHRGFETLTVVPQGMVDHTDSLGNGGRYGNGDTQLMSAGNGCVHSEMFPLVHGNEPNPLRLFQVWLNLPRSSKRSPPGYVMHWAENVKRVDGLGGASATVYLGQLGSVDSGSPTNPFSWSHDPANDVGVFHLILPPGGAKFSLPAARGGNATNRFAYIVEGGRGVVKVAGEKLSQGTYVALRGDADAVDFVNIDAEKTAEILVLQGRPIGEPVVSRGPFVMNSQEEIAECHSLYRSTNGFGGWPWDEDIVVFPREQGRFASFLDKKTGKKSVELPPAAGGKGGEEEGVKGEL